MGWGSREERGRLAGIGGHDGAELKMRRTRNRLGKRMGVGSVFEMEGRKGPIKVSDEAERRSTFIMRVVRAVIYNKERW